MYIYDHQFSGTAFERMAKGITLDHRPVLQNSSYILKDTAGLERHQRDSGAHGWSNGGFGEPVTQPSKSGDAQLRALRESLNKWRALNGESTITEMGPIGPQTKKAVLDFQRDSGFKRPDGIVGPATRERLAILLDILNRIPDQQSRLFELIRSAGFRSLEGPTQTEVLRQISLYAASGTPDRIRQLNRISNLITLVSRLGFELLRKSIQQLMLRILAAHPDQTTLGALLGSLVNSLGFRNLEEPTQTVVLKRIERYGEKMNRVENLVNMITMPPTFRFDLLSRETRNVMLGALANHPGDERIVNNFRTVITAPSFFGVAFRDLDQLAQTDLLSRVAAYPSNFRKITNLTELMKSRNFRSLAPDLRAQILDGLPTRFADVDLTVNIVDNLMTLVSALGFNKLRPEVQNLMLDVQAARPANAQLAAALANIAFGPKLHDRRIAAQTILQVNDSIPD